METIYEGTLKECKKYMEQLVIKTKHDERSEKIMDILERKKAGEINNEIALDRLEIIIYLLMVKLLVISRTSFRKLPPPEYCVLMTIL